MSSSQQSPHRIESPAVTAPHSATFTHILPRREPTTLSQCGIQPTLPGSTSAPSSSEGISRNLESPPKKRQRKPPQKHVNQHPRVEDLISADCCRKHVERVLKDDCYRLSNQKQKSSCDCSCHFRYDSGKADDEKFMPPSKAVARFVRLDYDHQKQAIANLMASVPPGSDASRTTTGAPMKASLPVVDGTGRKAQIAPCPETEICLYKLSKLLRCGRGMMKSAAKSGLNGSYKDLGPQAKLLPWPTMEGTQKDRWKDPKHGVVATAFQTPSQESKARCLAFIEEACTEMAKKQRRRAEMYTPFDLKKKLPLHDYNKLQLYDEEAIGVLFPKFRSNADKIRNLGHACFGEFLNDSLKYPKFLKDVRNETVEEIKRIPAFVSKSIMCNREIVAAGEAEQLLEELEKRMKEAAKTLAAAMKQIGESINNLVPGLTTKNQSAKSMKVTINQCWDQIGTREANELTGKIQEAEKQQTTALQEFVIDLETKFPNLFAGMLNAASFHRQVLHQEGLSVYARHVDVITNVVLFLQLENDSFNFVAVPGIRAPIVTFDTRFGYSSYQKYKQRLRVEELKKDLELVQENEDEFMTWAKEVHGYQKIRIYHLRCGSRLCFDATQPHMTVIPRRDHQANKKAPRSLLVFHELQKQSQDNEHNSK